jgi:ankyrin repeat protein
MSSLYVSARPHNIHPRRRPRRHHETSLSDDEDWPLQKMYSAMTARVLLLREELSLSSLLKTADRAWRSSLSTSHSCLLEEAILFDEAVSVLLLLLPHDYQTAL